METSSVHCLTKFVTERLTAAAEEILGVFEKTLSVYQEEIVRQRRLLDIVLKPEIKLQRTGLPQPSICKEEVLLDLEQCDLERNTSLDQEDPKSTLIKEELHGLCNSQDGEKFALEQETEAFKLNFSYDGDDHSVDRTLLLDPDETWSAAEKEPESNFPDEWMQSEPDRKHFVVTDPKSDLDQHVRTGTRYMCAICGKSFKISTYLKLHMKIHTGEKPHRCTYCEKEFAFSSSLTRHLRVHTGEKPYGCGLCGKRFNVSTTLKVHYRIHTVLPQQHVCKEEEVPADQQLCNQERNSSLVQEEPEPPQTTEEQEELCTSQEEEQLVLKQETDAFMLTPTYDKTGFNDKSSLLDPEQTKQSAAEEDHLDKICIKWVRSESARTNSGESGPNDDHLSLSDTSNVADYQDHRRENLGDSAPTTNTVRKPKKKCNAEKTSMTNSKRKPKNFQEREQVLKQQEDDFLKSSSTDERSDHSKDWTLLLDPDENQSREAAENKPPDSISCGRTTSESNRERPGGPEPNNDHQLLFHTSRVADHKSGNHGNTAKTKTKHKGTTASARKKKTKLKKGQKNQEHKTYSWEKTVSTAYSQPKTSDRSYKCNSCSKPFNVYTQLQVHMKTHTAERPFSCTVCGKRFGLKRYLKQHMITHSSEKPYSCNTCWKRFRRFEHVQIHMRSHTGERPYSCAHCQRAFSTSSALIKHVRLQHTDDVTAAFGHNFSYKSQTKRRTSAALKGKS